MSRLLPIALALAVVVTACTSSDSEPPDTTIGATTGPTTASVDSTATPERSFAGTEPAPEFPAGLDWINTPGPLTFEALEGKVVLLDFWTYGCINCIHIIPDLERLEAEFEDELVVIGVHSAKFANESETENIRQIVLRYELEHPVVNDRDFEVWRTWGANAWPTIVVVDPAGNVVGGHSGEGVYDVVQPVISSLVNEFDASGQLDRTPLEFTPITETAAETVLSFPGKVLASDDGSRLYIADTGHHRIVAIDPSTGEALAVYGSGRSGFADGPAESAQFDAPQGLAFNPDSSVLYVADTDNHAIRSVDLSTGNVATLAGTGELGWPPSAGPATEVALNSPWDIVERDETLWIAMAGTHQLWSMDLAAGTVGPRVGSAREGTRNGPFGEAELAQPSGLAFDGDGRLFFADSESSAIRIADLATNETLLASGSNENLFDFGDIDGIGGEARLQHPLGVAYWPEEDTILIADTYNSKIKTIDPTTLATTTYLGSDQGWADGTSTEVRFFEPGGIDIFDGTLYVADTNNHAIRSIDLATGTSSTIVIGGIERFAPPPDNADYRGTIIDLEDVTVGPGGGEIILDIRLPDAHKVNEQAPSSVVWSVAGSAIQLGDGADAPLTGVTFPVSIEATFGEGTGQLTADLTVIYCRDDAESLCLIEQVRFTGPVTVIEGGSASLTLSHEVVVPDLS